MKHMFSFRTPTRYSLVPSACVLHFFLQVCFNFIALEIVLNIYRMFVLSPLHFVQNQCLDILLSVAELKEPPAMNTSLAKVCFEFLVK